MKLLAKGFGTLTNLEKADLLTSSNQALFTLESGKEDSVMVKVSKNGLMVPCILENGAITELTERASLFM